LEGYYLFCVPLHGFLGKRETVRSRIEEKTFHKGGNSPAVSNIALEREENKRKEEKGSLQHTILFQVGSPPN